jgi:hypothetical protein
MADGSVGSSGDGGINVVKSVVRGGEMAAHHPAVATMDMEASSSKEEDAISNEGKLRDIESSFCLAGKKWEEES